MEDGLLLVVGRDGRHLLLATFDDGLHIFKKHADLGATSDRCEVSLPHGPSQ